MKDGSTTNKLLISNDDDIHSLESSIESLKEIIQTFNKTKVPSNLDKDIVKNK